MSYINKIVLAIVGFSLASCFGGVVSLRSTPDGAEVFHVEETTKKPLGKTPINIEISKHARKTGEHFHLMVAKEGFEPTSLLLPRTGYASDHHIAVTLDKSESDSNETKVGDIEQRLREQEACSNVTIDSFGELAQGIAAVQSLISARKLPEAETRLRLLETKYSFVSVVHDLLGNVAYLKRDLRSALTHYKRSVELWPNNPETQQLVTKISALLGTTAH